MSLLRDRKPRLLSAALTVSECEECLEAWFTELRERDVLEMLQVVASRWTDTVMPRAEELCRRSHIVLAACFVVKDPTLNPSKVKLQLALLALHSQKPCLFGSRVAEN